jgi:hypothetical protein
MSNKSKKDRHAYMLIAAVCVGVVILLGAKVALDHKVKRGPDNCLPVTDRQTVVLVDHSEVVTDQTREEIVARAMHHILQNVKVDERVTIFSVSATTQSSLKPVDSLCRPPDDGNRAVENVATIKKLFVHNFEERLRKALSEPISDSNRSPIAQAITDISLSQYLRGSANTLLVFSDMLEHTEKFSMYTCRTPDRVTSMYRDSRVGAKERPEFKNTAIALNIIPRLKVSRESLQCRDKFWPWFFGDDAGKQSSLRIDFLPGG